VDSLTGDTFFQSQFNIVVYSQGLYSKTFPIPGAGVAISGARELYSINGATVHVLQLDGTPIKNLSFPQIQNSQGIAIGQDGTKYIIDVAARAVHKLDSSDSYISNFALNLPSNLNANCGTVAVAPGGNLVVGVGGSTISQFLCTDMSVKMLTPQGTEIWSV